MFAVVRVYQFISLKHLQINIMGSKLGITEHG